MNITCQFRNVWIYVILLKYAWINYWTYRITHNLSKFFSVSRLVNKWISQTIAQIKQFSVLTKISQTSTKLVSFLAVMRNSQIIANFCFFAEDYTDALACICTLREGKRGRGSRRNFKNANGRHVIQKLSTLAVDEVGPFRQLNHFLMMLLITVLNTVSY